MPEHCFSGFGVIILPLMLSVLRSFVRNGVHHDQVLWGIVAEDWRLQRLPQQPPSLVN